VGEILGLAVFTTHDSRLTKQEGEAMTDPYAVFGLPTDSDDETIRRRYLELVRRYSPEHHPEKFAAVREAYEALKDQATRLRFRLFEAGRKENVDAIVEEVACQTSRRRVPTKELLGLLRKP
jgi:DnaJ-class molecular chaperone